MCRRDRRQRRGTRPRPAHRPTIVSTTDPKPLRIFFTNVSSLFLFLCADDAPMMQTQTHRPGGTGTSWFDARRSRSEEMRVRRRIYINIDFLTLAPGEDPTPYFSNQYNIIYKYTKIIAIVGSLRQQTDTVRSCLSSYVHIYDKSKISILSDLAILESILPNVNISIHSRTKPDM